MSDEDVELAPVIELRPGEEKLDQEAPLRIDVAVRRCTHHRGLFRLDPTAQRAYCRDCDQEVPPFEVLELFAKQFERFRWSYRHARDQARLAEQHLEELKRLERNAKVRVRTALGRAPACSCDEKLFAKGALSVLGGYPWCPVCGGRR